MRLTETQIHALNTHRLLNHYKTERRRFYGAGYTCGCGCGDKVWEIHPSNTDMKKQYDDDMAVKAELNKREHIDV